MRSTTKNIVLFLLLGLLAVLYILRAIGGGRDFEVFFETSRHFWAGEAIYSIARDQGFPFKYPPWILPFFLPLAGLKLEGAKILWAFLQLAGIALTVFELRRRNYDLRITFSVLLLYGGLWLVNAMDGQWTPLLLGLSLTLWRKNKGLLFIFLSSKVFTLFPFLSFSPKSFKTKSLLQFAGILIVMSIPAFWTHRSEGILGFLNAWWKCMGSSGSLLDIGGTRGLYNQGLPGFFTRILQTPPTQLQVDIGLSIVLGSILALLWKRTSSTLSSFDSWCGWIALIPVIHPLPFWYSFVFAYPLSVVAIHQSIVSEKTKAIALSCLGTFMISALTQKTLGPKIGFALEYVSIKSWGIILCLMALSVASSALPKASGAEKANNLEA